MSKKKGHVRVGTSGWTFPSWRGKFYPKNVSQKNELAYASQMLSSIEINSTFYRLQKPATFQSWYDQVPEDFVFSVKGGQTITHVRRLKDVEEPLGTFLGSGVLCLKEKLGPILWQFPPNVTLKDERFEKFFKLLPRDSKEAAKFALKKGRKVEGKNFTPIKEEFPLRYAFEFRHESFKNKAFIELMRKHDVAVVFAHSGEKSPYMEDLTSDFVYARMHGEGKKFKRGYPDDELTWFAKRACLWREGKQPKDAECVSMNEPAEKPRDIFVYFDTEAKVRAPQDAKRFLKLIE